MEARDPRVAQGHPGVLLGIDTYLENNADRRSVSAERVRRKAPSQRKGGTQERQRGRSHGRAAGRAGAERSEIDGQAQAALRQEAGRRRRGRSHGRAAGRAGAGRRLAIDTTGRERFLWLATSYHTLHTTPEEPWITHHKLKYYY